MNKRLFVLTGPAGVGKSTTANALAEKIEKCAHVSGDVISHMCISGREKPWESERACHLVWNNMKALSENFMNDGYDVIMDWIMFENDVKHHLEAFVKSGVEVRYIILWADEDVHIARDQSRPEEAQMGARVKILRNEFEEYCVDRSYYLDNTSTDTNKVVDSILNDPQFLLNI